MARADFITMMHSKHLSPLEFNFETIQPPKPLFCYVTPEDVANLNYLATSKKLSSKIEIKYKEIDKIMTRRGFKKFHCGTNRIVYSFLEDQSFIVKIALDRVGLGDNPAEFRNQHLLKPFVTKVFEVSPCGTIGTFERVLPITSRQEFLSIADDIFNIITNKFIGKYVLEDIGTKYFMNYGIRSSIGPVLLDFPYVFELDGNKLYCNNPIPELKTYCGGTIDYDDGFNSLICDKCGKRYLATELKNYKEEKSIVMMRGEGNMKVSIRRGNEIIMSSDNTVETASIQKRFTHSEREVTVPDDNEGFKVSFRRHESQIENKNIPIIEFDKNKEEENIPKEIEKKVFEDTGITSEAFNEEKIKEALKEEYNQGELENNEELKKEIEDLKNRDVDNTICKTIIDQQLKENIEINRQVDMAEKIKQEALSNITESTESKFIKPNREEDNIGNTASDEIPIGAAGNISHIDYDEYEGDYPTFQKNYKNTKNKNNY